MANYVKTLSFKNLLNYQLFGLNSLDTEQLKRLRPLLNHTEAELSAELDSFSEDQYSYKKRRQTLIAIRASLDKVEEILRDDFEKEVKAYYDLGQSMAETEVKQFNTDQAIQTPSISKLKTSIDQNKFLINNAEASLRTYTAEIRQTVSNAITQGMLAGRTGYEITSNLKRYLNIKKWRIQRIVRTESHKIYNSAKLITYGQFKKEDFPDLMKRLVHRWDHRTGEDSKQLSQIDPAIPLNQPFVFTYKYRRKDGVVKKYKRVFMTPPDRPNDRATLIPFRQAWEK